MAEPDLDARTREQMQQEIDRREATIHTLNARLAQERLQVARAYGDVEAFTFWLQAAERRIGRLERTVPAAYLRRWRDRLLGRSPAPVRPPAAPAPDRQPVPSARFRYYLRQPPFRVYREPTFTLEGWAFPEDGSAVTGLRARVDAEVYFGTYGVDEPFVPEWHDVQPNNPRPGFKIIVDTPVGRHRLSLEAQLGRPQWVSFLSLPIWCVGEGTHVP